MNEHSPLRPPPERFNIARYCLADQAATWPDKTALIIAGGIDRQRQWSYRELDLMVRRLAGGLRALGLHAGERLMIRMDNDLEYILTFFAALTAGLVPLPSSAALTSEEAEFLLANSEAAALALSDDLPLAHAVPSCVRMLRAEEIAGLARSADPIDYAGTSAADPGFLIYTSGTAGRPKGVLHGHRTAWGRRPMYQGWYGITSDDIVLHAGAFNWTYTLGVGLIDPWANGATAVLYNGPPDPAVWPELIGRFGVTIFATVPSLYRRILKYGSFGGDRLSTLRHGLTAGEALPPVVLDSLASRDRQGAVRSLGNERSLDVRLHGPRHGGQARQPRQAAAGPARRDPRRRPERPANSYRQDKSGYSPCIGPTRA